MQRIVLGTDFSSGSEGAVEAAAHLASLSGACITLVHVCEPPAPPPPAPPPTSARAVAPHTVAARTHIPDERELTVVAEAALAEMTQRLRARGLAVGALLRWGVPHAKIDNVATDVGADLIIVGMQGRHGVDKLLGSVADNVLRHARRPVLLVPRAASLQRR